MTKTKSDGSASSYYDVFPDKPFQTTNDMIEHFAVIRWKEYSTHFKDIVKAMVRWGTKDGTSMEYDARKIIYSGARLLLMVTGSKEEVRNTLSKLANDNQFKD